MSIKVMLADDHVLMREGIRQLLEFDGTISVIAEANNGVECMEQLLSVHPDILLLDINMPVMNGIEVLQEIKKKNISVKVLVLTVHNEVEYLLKAVDIGIDGYIMKDAESAELKRAINCIMQGETKDCAFRLWRRLHHQRRWVRLHLERVAEGLGTDGYARADRRQGCERDMG